MPKTVSDSWKTDVNKVHGADLPRILLEIDHVDLASPIRVVNDVDNVTSNSNVFAGAPFRITLPEESDTKIPEALLAVDNVGKPPDGNSIAEWLEISNGGRGATCRIMVIRLSDPDTIEWEITMLVNTISVNIREITANLGFRDILGRAGIVYRYDPSIVPGLF